VDTNRPFQFQKRRQLFIRVHNETPSAAQDRARIVFDCRVPNALWSIYTFCAGVSRVFRCSVEKRGLENRAHIGCLTRILPQPRRDTPRNKPAGVVSFGNPARFTAHGAL
jgi:hypothetical protein